MRKLNTDRPYAHVTGLLGASFEQDGVFFAASGNEVIDPQPDTVEEAKLPENDDVIIRPAEVVESPAPNSNKAIGEMDERHLKTLVESYGEKYIDKDSALKFLYGDKAA